MTTDLARNGPPALDLERLSDTQLRQRIELNKAARFGLQEASPAQLNIIFVLARRWNLDPVTDLTLFQGHPWITADGWARIIRRHPEWTTYRQYPLGKDDKRDWGYSPDDIVVATVLGTKSHGEITGYGKVTKAEIDDARDQGNRNNRRPAPIALHPVEMAQKRSLARTARLAFGQDVPDETMIEQEIAEEMALRADPERSLAAAKKYHEIFPDEDERPTYVPTRERDEPDVLTEALESNRELQAQAIDLKITVTKSLRAESAWPIERIDAANDELRERIRSHAADQEQSLL